MFAQILVVFAIICVAVSGKAPSSKVSNAQRMDQIFSGKTIKNVYLNYNEIFSLHFYQIVAINGAYNDISPKMARLLPLLQLQLPLVQLGN